MDIFQLLTITGITTTTLGMGASLRTALNIKDLSCSLAPVLATPHLMLTEDSVMTPLPLWNLDSRKETTQANSRRILPQALAIIASGDSAIIQTPPPPLLPMPGVVVTVRSPTKPVSKSIATNKAIVLIDSSCPAIPLKCLLLELPYSQWAGINITKIGKKSTRNTE